MAAHLRPYTYSLFLLAYMPLVLWADVHVASLVQQHLLGVLTLAVLLAALRASGPLERRQVLCAMAIATACEYFNTGIWGVYAYRLHNVPLYVPTGHGLVYLFALLTARTPLLRRHGRVAAVAALMVAVSWAARGLLFGAAPDLAGAALLPIVIWSCAGRDRAVYACAFFIASLLEILGTSFGNWTWAPITPLLGLSSGNPPSCIAAVYCLLDLSAIRLATAVPWPLPRRRRPTPVPAAQEA